MKVAPTKVRKTLLISILYAVVWILTYHLISWISNGSPSRKAYGLLSACWSALYFSSIFEITVKNLPGVGALSSFIMTVCLIVDKNILFYVNDLSDLISALIFFLSPMILNSVLLLLKSKYFDRRKTD